MEKNDKKGSKKGKRIMKRDHFIKEETIIARQNPVGGPDNIRSQVATRIAPADVFDQIGQHHMDAVGGDEMTVAALTHHEVAVR